MRRDDIKYAVQILVRNFPLGRRQKLRFKNNKPGDKFCRNCRKRYTEFLSFGKPCKQEPKRYLATNPEVRPNRPTAFELLIGEQNIDAKRIINSDESGMSADN